MNSIHTLVEHHWEPLGSRCYFQNQTFLVEIYQYIESKIDRWRNTEQIPIHIVQNRLTSTWIAYASDHIHWIIDNDCSVWVTGYRYFARSLHCTPSARDFSAAWVLKIIPTTIPKVQKETHRNWNDESRQHKSLQRHNLEAKSTTNVRISQW